VRDTYVPVRRQKNTVGRHLSRVTNDQLSPKNPATNKRLNNEPGFRPAIYFATAGNKTNLVFACQALKFTPSQAKGSELFGKDNIARKKRAADP
jgi:hypothetical protein